MFIQENEIIKQKYYVAKLNIDFCYFMLSFLTNFKNFYNAYFITKIVYTNIKS